MHKSTLPKKQVGFYPERSTLRQNQHKGLSRILGYASKRLTKRFSSVAPFCQSVNCLEKHYAALTPEELRSAAEKLRNQLHRNTIKTELAAELFALVREQAQRILNLRHFDVQLVGGWVMLNGMVAEMSTGEGKTLAATLPASFAALAGIPVHIITANDYLAQRDADLMRPLYRVLGISVGAIQAGMSGPERKKIYDQDIVYCSNKEIVFDYLKDRLLLKKTSSTNMNLPLRKFSGDTAFMESLRLRGLHFAIVDEADCIFIDEARTPLIVSQLGDCGLPGDIYATILPLAKGLREQLDFVINQNQKSIEITARGSKSIAFILEQNSALLTYHPFIDFLFNRALTALYLFENGREYIICDGKLALVGEQTGRVMPGRSWEMGLQQFIEVKEGCEITGQPETLIKINFQKFFNRYHQLAGMTGTAKEVRRELWDVYQLHVITIPTNVPRVNKNLGCQLYLTNKDKYKAVLDRVQTFHLEKRPILLGTSSVASSEKLSGLLHGSGLAHNLLNARQDQLEAEIIAQAGTPGRITVATNMAGRGTDIVLTKEIARLGGLHVMATECANPERIDRQLFGRCGRQGDPGSFEALFSLEDPLFTNDNMGLAAKLLCFCIRHLKYSNQFLAKMLIRSVQKKIEYEYYLMRRQLLEQDSQREKLLSFSKFGD